MRKQRDMENGTFTWCHGLGGANYITQHSTQQSQKQCIKMLVKKKKVASAQEKVTKRKRNVDTKLPLTMQSGE